MALAAVSSFMPAAAMVASIGGQDNEIFIFIYFIQVAFAGEVFILQNEIVDAVLLGQVPAPLVVLAVETFAKVFAQFVPTDDGPAILQILVQVQPEIPQAMQALL